MKITNSQAVFIFEENKKVALELGASLIELERNTGGKLLTLSVPDLVPPEAPRIMLQASDFIISVGFSRLEISSKIPGHITGDAGAAGEFVQQMCRRIVPTIFGGALRYQWAGILWQTNHEMPGSPRPSIELMEPVFDKLYSVPRGSRSLAAFQFQFGFFDDGYFSGYTISGYELRAGSITGVSDGSGTFTVDLDQLPIKESGLQIVTDVNNQRRQNNDPLNDFDQLLKRQVLLAGGALESVGLKELFE